MLELMMWCVVEKWKNAGREEKAVWQTKAEEEAIAHRAKYPGESLASLLSHPERDQI